MVRCSSKVQLILACLVASLSLDAAVVGSSHGGSEPPDYLLLLDGPPDDRLAELVKDRFADRVILKQGARYPAELLDAAGLDVRVWRSRPSHREILRALDEVTPAAPMLVAAGRTLQQGDVARGRLERGLAYLSIRWISEARAELDLARKATSDPGMRQVIDAQSAWSFALEGEEKKALEVLARITSNPASDEAGAAAWLISGYIHQHAGDTARAENAFRSAARLAPRQSDIREAGLTRLAALGAVLESTDEPGAIVLLPPARAISAGRTRFRTLVSDPRVESVRFFLDGEEVAHAREVPFDAVIDLGEIPSAREIRAVALSHEGKELGRDAIGIHGGHAAFGIRLADPAGGRFEAEVDVPARRRVQRVEAWLDDRLVLRFDAPPFAAPLDVARAKVLRAVATLDDGSVAEDVKLLAGEGYRADVEVRLVELWLTIEKGDSGELAAEDFVVRENGIRQIIEEYVPAPSTPLTVGLVLDASGSMIDEMPSVQSAALSFLRAMLRRGDEAFLVSFDATPRLLQGKTGDLLLLADRIRDLRAGGGTALYDAIVFSLLQMEGSEGRKVLVVLTDGKDKGSSYGYRAASKLAATMGARIYVLLMEGLTAAAPFYGDLKRNQLRDLTADTGGRLFFVTSASNLSGIYEAIRDELAGDALLTYRSSSKEGGAKKIDVTTRSGILVRHARSWMPRQ